ncbi:hypothetical protein [Candidatus Palauibacter sp.]|uniref:hypothetical protein n=1 Tax=Candidatus Palauibacter sp. TaxID=3101350 RepID=UPI003B0120C5
MTYQAKRLTMALVLAVFAGAWAAEFVAAQDFLFGRPSVTVGVRFGYALPRAEGEIFDFTRDELTIDKADFNSAAFGLDLGVRLSDRLDLSAGIGYENSEIDSEFRDFIGDDDLPILQTTSFERVPFTLGLKAYLTERGRRISDLAWIPAKWAPFVGGGVGVVWYEFEQHGEFVDYETLDIFFDRFTSSSGSVLGYATAGFDYSLGLRWIFTAEARYSWASADMGDDFFGFDPIDLTGLRAALGFSLRL